MDDVTSQDEYREMSQIEKLKLLIGDEDMMSQGSDVSDPDSEHRPDPNLEPQPNLSTLDIFSGPEYRNEMIEPVSYRSDSDEEASSRPFPSPLPPKPDIQKFIKAAASRRFPAAETRSEKVKFSAKLNSNAGQLASSSITFCPILAVAKYPYKYVTKETQERVAQAFFAGGKFWERKWDLYYIHPPAFISVKPLILVPATQVKELIKEINDFFGCELTFPFQAEEVGFHQIFSDDNTPRPRYLGRSVSRSSYDSMVENTPDESYRPTGEPSQTKEATDRSLNAYKRKIELAFEATKNKSKASKAKKKGERIQKQQSWIRQLKRTQRYLGVRQRRLEKREIDWGSMPGEPKTNEKASDKLDLQIDLTKTVPFQFDEAIVFIAVDVEAYERDHTLITEIGISTLDTLDLVGLPPGVDGKGWMAKIRARHFRIKEFSHLENKDFVNGCSDKFEFGKSEWISKEDAPEVVASCFRYPFSGPLNNGQEDERDRRNIILVGHNTSTDITYLQNMGYNPKNLANLFEILDTASLYQALTRDVQPRALGTILYELDLSGWNLHNAGNDAAYTLQAMIGITLRSLGSKEERAKMEEEERAKKVRNAIKEAAERVLEEREGWSTEDEDDDGGIAVSPSRSDAETSANIEVKDNATGSKGKEKAEDYRMRAKLEQEATIAIEVFNTTGPEATPG